MALVEMVEQDLATRVAESWGPADFERLYAQNVDSARRVAMAVTGSRQDAEDAVAEGFSRVYLRLSDGGLADHGDLKPFIMTVVRNSAIDLLRRDDRDRRAFDRESKAPTTDLPSDLVQRSAEHRMIRDAFAGLPDRWREVLWLTVVEGMPPRSAAPILRMAPNAVSQLAVRARSRLAERYVEAHLGPGARSGDCRVVSRHIGRHVTRRLGPAGRARLDSHLGSCTRCAELVDEIDDLGPTLRRSGYALPLLAGAATPTGWWDLLRNAYDGIRSLGRGLWLHATRIAHVGPSVALATADPLPLLPAGLAVVGLGAALGIVGPVAGDLPTAAPPPAAAVVPASDEVGTASPSAYLAGSPATGSPAAPGGTGVAGIQLPAPGEGVVPASLGIPAGSTGLTGANGPLGSALGPVEAGVATGVTVPTGNGAPVAADVAGGVTVPTGNGAPVVVDASAGLTLPTASGPPVAADVSAGLSAPTSLGGPVEAGSAAGATVPGVGALPSTTASVDSALSAQLPGKSAPGQVGLAVTVGVGDGPPAGVGVSVPLPKPSGVLR